MNKFILLAGAAAWLSWGCASAPQSANMVSNPAPAPDAQLFADYLVGSYANYTDNAPVRAEYYSRAYKSAPADIGLGRRAVTSAITAGDLDKARKLARQVLKQDPSEPMSRAVLGAQAFADGKYNQAATYFAEDTPDLTIQILTDIMQSWVLAAQGKTVEAQAQMATYDGGGYFAALGQWQIANLGEMDAAGDINEAFDAVVEAGVAPIEAELSRARILADKGYIEEAYERLTAFNVENGPFETGPVPVYLRQLNAGNPIDEDISPQGHAARALTESSYGFFVRNRAIDVAEVFLRVALELDPDYYKARLWLGSILESSDRYDEAMALYQSVPESSPYIVSARLSVANVYFSQDEDDQALDVLEDTNDAYPTFVTRESLGRARLIREKYEEALPIYDALVKSMSEAQIEANTEPLYFRGICYERTGQWDLAVEDFLKVLEIEPENADALNYLGYTWVDRNENLERAFEMIEKAVELQPNSGAIVDSLGWAHYKLGNYQKARENLERAVELSPSSATIIDHLGDAYWKLGRYREAGYQWERALESDPTEEEEETIRRKLKNGLETAQPSP